MQNDDQKYDMFKIAKGMVKTNHTVSGEQFTIHDDGLL